MTQQSGSLRKQIHTALNSTLFIEPLAEIKAVVQAARWLQTPASHRKEEIPPRASDISLHPQLLRLGVSGVAAVPIALNYKKSENHLRWVRFGIYQAYGGKQFYTKRKEGPGSLMTWNEISDQSAHAIIKDPHLRGLYDASTRLEKTLDKEPLHWTGAREDVLVKYNRIDSRIGEFVSAASAITHNFRQRFNDFFRNNTSGVRTSGMPEGYNVAIREEILERVNGSGSVQRSAITPDH